MIKDYLLKFHFQDCLDILTEEDVLGYYSVKIDFLKLFETNPDVGDKVLCSPVETLETCNRDLVKAQQKILEDEEYKTIISKLIFCFLKRNVMVRFFGLPVCPELHRTIFPKNVDLGCFLKVTGTIVRVTQAKMLEYQRKYICVKCKYENIVEAEFENRYILKAPTKCGNDESRCRASTFTQVNLVSREHCRDYQEIKIQEQVNKLSIGTIPGSLWVVLENDLVDCCKPGDDVNICGTVRRRWRPSSQTKKSEVELVLQANYVEVSNTQRSEIVSTAPDVKDCFTDFWSKYEACPLKGRDHILSTVSPQVYGLHLVKLAVLLTVITGSNHESDSDGDKRTAQEDSHTTRVRGQCHLLLVGDPGTGKSQLLRAACQLTSRAVFTSGAGSTRAGLTCAALREEGEWQLEAGALVLSDGGVCCIDEISQLRDHDRTAIHEAMEQQTISIAKAGIVCKLNTRCAVIAACNPKGHYETDQPLSVNVSLGTPLLSRFDLIFILLDSKNKVWDKLVSSYIMFGGGVTENKKKWSLEKLQTYIALIGPRPTNMTQSANIILQSYYMMQRKSVHRDPSRTTVRMLDSLVRLSQAHCRLMYRTTILPVDAIMAVSLMDLSMQDCTLEDTADALHTTFQKYPDFDYLCMAKKLLTTMNLDKIWQEELLYYGKLLQVDHKTLEHQIDNGNPHAFAKYDDVTDDSIPLSSTLVTSSYFNNKDNLNKKGDSDGDNEQLEESFIVRGEVSDKLAKTLQKHAALNKGEKKPPMNQKNAKRKRKVVTIETKLIGNKKSKLKIERRRKAVSESSDEVEDPNIILNAVPSVNDIFSDLDLDLKVETRDTTDPEIDPAGRNDISDNKVTKINEVVEMNGNKDESTHTKSWQDKSSNIVSKLKCFEFKNNRDYDKLAEEKINRSWEETNKEIVVKLENTKGCNSNSSKHSVPSSQISIFESSDCDIDLDL